MASSKYKSLQKSILQGNLDNVKTLLQQCDLPNSEELHKVKKRAKLETLTDQQQFDLLRKAINKSYQEIVKLLLDNGFKICYESSKTSPASLIEAAVKTADPEVLKLLLSHEDITAKFERREINKLLFEAIKTENVDIVKIILENGADINAMNRNGYALHQAIRHESPEIVTFLLEKGADVSIVSLPSNYRLIQEAISTRNSEIFRIILNSGTDVSIALPSGSNLLSFAAGHGNPEMVQYFLEKGIDINGRDETDRPPLIYAIENKREDIVELLLLKGADADIGCDYGKLVDSDYKGSKNWYTALHIAVQFGNATIVKLLLDHGSKVNPKCNSYGFILEDNWRNYTPLHIACEKGFLEIVRVLNNYGAIALDLQENEGRSIHHGAANGQKGVVQLLLDQGIFDISAACVKKALESAARWGNFETVELLVKKGVPFGNALREAIEGEYTKILQFLLDQGADVNHVSFLYWQREVRGTPLYHALTSLRPKARIVKMLLDAGADINVKNNKSVPLIHYCISSFRDAQIIQDTKHIIDLLLEHGADINERDSNGRMLLHRFLLEDTEQQQWVGRYYKSYPNIYILQYLVKIGADFNVTDRTGRTIVHISPTKDAKMLLKVIIHVKHMNGAFISENISEYVRRDITLNGFFIQCEEEVERMKMEKLNGTDVTLFDVFKAKFNQLLAYARNDRIVEYFEAKRCQKKFPKFARLIEEHFQPALFRRQMLDEGKSYFRLLFKGNEMPVTCRDKIFSHLSIDDLINLSKVCRSYNRINKV